MPEALLNPERVFADTNLLLRYLTNDVPSQADAVESLIRQAGTGGITLVTTVLTIAEIVWTLESYYELDRIDIQAKVLAILNTPGLEVADRDLIVQASLEYVEKNVDFIDAYHAMWLDLHGMTTVYTFDRRHFSRFQGIQVRVPG